MRCTTPLATALFSQLTPARRSCRWDLCFVLASAPTFARCSASAREPRCWRCRPRPRFPCAAGCCRFDTARDLSSAPPAGDKREARWSVDDQVREPENRRTKVMQLRVNWRCYQRGPDFANSGLVTRKIFHCKQTRFGRCARQLMHSGVRTPGESREWVSPHKHFAFTALFAKNFQQDLPILLPSRWCRSIMTTRATNQTIPQHQQVWFGSTRMRPLSALIQANAWHHVTTLLSG